MKLSILNNHFNIQALFLEYTDLMRGINFPYIEYCFICLLYHVSITPSQTLLQETVPITLYSTDHMVLHIP